MVVVFVLASCASPQQARYFNELRDSKIKNVNPENLDQVIREGDLLNITVSSLNPEASAVFNSPLSTLTAGISGAFAQPAGYLVQKEGIIVFPVIGEIQAAGLTKKQLSVKISNEILEKKLLIDPIVSVRFLNYQVTVLGEVGKPSVINVPSERITILEALGYAGDMTLFAKRDNVLLIREDKNSKIIKRLNLNSDEIFKSPYFYLQARDVIYVESNKTKVQGTSRATQLLPTILSALAFLAIIFDRTLN